jgi:hypothetical protein
MARVAKIAFFETVKSCSVSYSSPSIQPASLQSQICSDLAPELGDPSIDVAECVGWESLKITVTVAIEGGDLPPVIGPTGFDGVSPLVVLNCGKTKVRRGQKLLATVPGTWSGEVELIRAELADAAALNVRVIANRDFEGIFKGAVLFETPPLNVVLVRRADQNIEGHVRIEWRDFSKEEGNWLSSRQADLFFVDTTDEPVLYLNSAISDLQSLLDDAEQPPAFESLKYQVASMIAVATHNQMCLSALNAIERDDEEEFRIEPAWKRSCVDMLVKTLYPDLSSEEGLKQCFVDVNENYPEICGKVLGIVQGLAKLDKRFSKAIGLAKASSDYEAREEAL